MYQIRGRRAKVLKIITNFSKKTHRKDDYNSHPFYFCALKSTKNQMKVNEFDLHVSD